MGTMSSFLDRTATRSGLTTRLNTRPGHTTRLPRVALFALLIALMSSIASATMTRCTECNRTIKCKIDHSLDARNASLDSSFTKVHSLYRMCSQHCEYAYGSQHDDYLHHFCDVNCFRADYDRDNEEYG